MREDTSGQFGGLGIEVTMEEDLVKVVTPYDDSPASRAGILANDLIVEIDGQQVMGMTLDEAVDLMRGEVGTEIDFVIAREGADQLIELTLTRDIISVAAVRWTMNATFPSSVCPGFPARPMRGWKTRSAKFSKKTTGKRPQASFWICATIPAVWSTRPCSWPTHSCREGSVVLTRGRTATTRARAMTRSPTISTRMLDGVPIIVLINGGSASAAEIVAGALQDHRRATLVGTRSFGKGSVQSIIPLGFDGAMRLTTARYYTPNNRSIQALGITPDIQVLQDVPEEFQGRDEIIGEAGLGRPYRGRGRRSHGWFLGLCSRRSRRRQSAPIRDRSDSWREAATLPSRPIPTRCIAARENEEQETDAAQ